MLCRSAVSDGRCDSVSSQQLAVGCNIIYAAATQKCASSPTATFSICIRNGRAIDFTSELEELQSDADGDDDVWEGGGQTWSQCHRAIYPIDYMYACVKPVCETRRGLATLIKGSSL